MTLTSARHWLAEVQVHGPPGGYEDWADEKGMSLEDGRMDADPDGDGTTNLLEFALGGEPLSGADRGYRYGVIAGDGGDASFVFTIATLPGAVFGAEPDHALAASTRGITYRIGASADLADWTEVIQETGPVTGGLPVPPLGYIYHSFTTPGTVADTPREFFCIKVTSP